MGETLPDAPMKPDPLPGNGALLAQFRKPARFFAQPPDLHARPANPFQIVRNLQALPFGPSQIQASEKKEDPQTLQGAAIARDLRAGCTGHPFLPVT